MGVEVVPVRGTRASLASEREEIAENETASTQSECQPLDLLQVIDLPDSYFEDLPAVTPVDKLITLPEGEVVNVPLPCIDDVGCDRDKLVAEQQADESLKNVFELARRNEKGYALE